MTRSTPVSHRVESLAVFTASARSPVFFDQKGEIEHVPLPESPGRLVKQLALLGQALALLRAEPTVSCETYRSLYRTGWDTLPDQRARMLRTLLAPERDGYASTTTEVAEAARYPTTTTRRYLQELAALRLIDRLPADKQGTADRGLPADALLKLLETMQGPEETP